MGAQARRDTFFYQAALYRKEVKVPFKPLVTKGKLDTTNVARVFKKMKVVDSPPTSVDGRLDAPVHFLGFTYDGANEEVEQRLINTRSPPWDSPDVEKSFGKRVNSKQSLQIAPPTESVETLLANSLQPVVLVPPPASSGSSVSQASRIWSENKELKEESAEALIKDEIGEWMMGAEELDLDSAKRDWKGFGEDDQPRPSLSDEDEDEDGLDEELRSVFKLPPVQAIPAPQPKTLA